MLVRSLAGGDVGPFLEQLRARFDPSRVLVVTTEGPDLSALEPLVPLLAYKVAIDGRATAYVCEAGGCDRPTTDPTVFAEQIAPVRPYGE